ncbi:MAG: hypothetical protein HFH47_01225, partial [Bacilli bacterium]|nr:hypothetical protein [Bacilli bacterium]
KINDIIGKIKEVLSLENQWCDVFNQIVANNDFAENLPLVSFDSLDSVLNALGLAEERFQVNVDGKFDASIDYSNISRDFINYYRQLIKQKEDLLIDGYQKKLNELSNVYSDDVIKKISKYKMEGEEFKYNVGGVKFELKDKQDIENILGIIEDYELENEQEISQNIEVIEPIPLSQTSPEVQASFSKIIEKDTNLTPSMEKEQEIELKNGAKAKVKQFKNNAKKVIKFVGNKLVAVKNNLLTNLKSYYADVNIAHENNLETNFSEPMALPVGEEYIELPKENVDINIEMPKLDELKTEPIVIEPNSIHIDNGIELPKVIEEDTITVLPTNDKEKLLSKYSSLIKERALGKHAGESKTLSKEEIDFTVDNYLDNLIKVGEEKYGDNFVEDIMKEATSESIKWLMDEVSQGENLKEISENTINQIDSMDEYQLENYLNKLTLSNEELMEFNKRVNDYMQANPNSNEFSASKEALKSMTGDIELIKPSIVEKSQNIQVPSEGPKVVMPEPIIIEPIVQTNEPVDNEKTVDKIEKMNNIELTEYIQNSNLSMEELERFTSLVKQYKNDYPGVNDSMAKKACIKAIMDTRELEQQKMARTSIIEAKK